MRVKKYLALTFAAILATTMLTACPWDQEEDETDDASSVPVTSTDTGQDDDDHDSGDDDSQPTKPTLTLNGQTITVGQTSEEINVENGAYTVALTQSGGTDGTLTMTIATQPEKNYVTNSVTATVGNASASWTRDTTTRARTLSVRADTKLSLTTNDEGKTFTLTGIPSNATSCTIDVKFSQDSGYTIADDGTYMVYNADGLKAFADEVNGGNRSLKCTLTADINLTEQSWTPIGSYSNRYTGTFDGAGHTISNLNINTSNNDVGLFGFVDGGTVKNLNLTNVSVSGGTGVGGVVGTNGGTIQGCMVSGSVSGNDLVGGVAGDNFGTVKGCCFAGDSVSGSNYVGGVVGHYYTGSITACYWQAGTGGPSQGVGFGDGGENCEKVEGGNWSNAIDAMNEALKQAGCSDVSYKPDTDGKPVLVADGSSTSELPGLTQRVLDVVRAVGL